MALTIVRDTEAETIESLSTLGGVRRAMARVYARLRRPGRVDVARARVEIAALEAIARVLQDARDHRWQRRLDDLWRWYQTQRGPLPPAGLPAETSAGATVDAVPVGAVASEPHE
jgi:hypothetical protein